MLFPHQRFASIIAVGLPGELPTVGFALPGSDIYPVDLFHLRRALVGGTLARAWVAFDHGGTSYAFSFQHGPSGGQSSADPTAFVSALSGYTHVLVDLGTTSQTATQVATAFQTAASGQGITVNIGSTDSAGRVEVEVEGGSSLTLPTAVDMTDEALRGMWGAQRDNWGNGTDVANRNVAGGAVNETSMMHLGHPNSQSGLSGRAGRILAVYTWGTSGYQPLLAASSGPAQGATPASFTPLAEAVAVQACSAVGDGPTDGRDNITAAIFPAVEVSTSAEIWAHHRDDSGTGAPRLRAHGDATVEGNGDIGVSVPMLYDTTGSHGTGDSFGATYTPGEHQSVNFYEMIGIVFELADASGNYHGDGSLELLYGDHNDDTSHGTQLDVAAATLANEVTAHRLLFPEYTGDVEAYAAARVVNAIGATEDSRFALYRGVDLSFPAGTAHTLIADTGMMGIDTAEAYNVHTFATPVGLSTSDIGTGTRYLMATFNYVNDTGALATYNLPIFFGPGDGAWLDCWEDDRTTWHDDIPGASGGRAFYGGVTEYRSRNIAGMPIDDFSDTYPDPWVTDATDDSPAAIALDRLFIRRSGIAAVAA